jgi:type VI secretion system protein ImpM
MSDETLSNPLNPFASGPIGWYGKLPALGDFLRRNLPEEFLPAWDAWLQSGMATAAREHGDEWRDDFLRFPVWYFLRTLPAAGEEGGSAGMPDGAFAGMLIPSADRVGRLYPLTIAFMIPAPLFERMSFTELESRLEDIETLALAVLNDDNLQGFEQALDMLPPMRAAGTAAPVVAPAALAQQLGRQALLLKLRTCTLFWAPDAGPVEPMLLAPLPLQADSFCKLVRPLTTPLMAQ